MLAQHSTSIDSMYDVLFVYTSRGGYRVNASLSSISTFIIIIIIIIISSFEAGIADAISTLK